MSGMKPWTTSPLGPVVGQAGTGTVIAQSYVAVSGAADTNENTLATITIPANTLGANGAVRVTLGYSFTSNANVKTFRARFSGASGTIYLTRAVSTQTNETGWIVIGNRNSVSSQVGAYSTINASGTAVSGQTTSAVDTTAATTIVITAQKATGSDTVTLEFYTVEVIKP